MKKAILFLIIVSLLVLAAGCSVQEYKTAKTAEKEAQTQLAEVQEKAAEVESAYEPVKTSQPAAAVYEEDEKEDKILNIETEAGPLGLKNLGDYRDKKDDEMCNMDYPFQCAEYLAREGIIKLNLKYGGYPSTISDVEVSFAGELCDPVAKFMEAGSITIFTCYADDVPMITGEVEIKY